MEPASLDQIVVHHAETLNAIKAERPADAVRIAEPRAATAICDLAAAHAAAGNVAAAVRLLRETVELLPGNQAVFHNLVAVLLRENRFRGEQVRGLLRHMMRNWDANPWLAKYRNLLFTPVFLNVEFVSGKCNLKCRMCVGTQSAEYPNRLRSLAAEDFRRTLVSVPTIDRVVLSSGDSEPLLHPELDTILDIARAQGVHLDIFTNGHPLGAKTCRKMVETQIVAMLNVSIDAATPETYRRVRGASMERLLGKLEMLCAMKREMKRELPWLSFSFVAMADTIHELPGFVRLAQRFGAGRVFVEDLIGWDGKGSENHPATENPRWAEHVEEAAALAAEAKVLLQLPERLRRRPDASVLPTEATAGTVAPPDAAEGPGAGERWAHCSWLNGAYVDSDGAMDPCCLIHGVADMGSVREGPVLANEKYLRVKRLLQAGKVFPECRNQRMCAYVQQQIAAGKELRIMSPAELADVRPARPPRCEAARELAQIGAGA